MEKEIKTINFWFYSLFSGAQDSPVTQTCLGCICEASSGCNRTTTCNGDVCGLFRLTWAYWADAGKPTVAGESPTSETGTYYFFLTLCVRLYFLANNGNCLP